MAVTTEEINRQTACFEDFYEQHVDTVYRFLRVRATEHLAEELTAEVFVAAFKKWDSSETLQLGWLITTARRRLIDEWRRQDRSRRRESELVARGKRQHSCEETATDDRLLVLKVLDGLPSSQRQALILRYLDDRPVPAVAEVLNRSYSATESLLSRARRNFACRFEEATGRSHRGHHAESTPQCCGLRSIA